MRREAGRLSILSAHNCSHTRQDQNKTVRSLRSWIPPLAYHWKPALGGKVEQGKSQPVKTVSPAPPLRRETEDYGRYTDDSLGSGMFRGLYRTPAPTPVRVFSRLNPGAGERALGQEGTTTAAVAVSKKAVAVTRAELYPKGPSERRTSPAVSRRPPEARGRPVGGRGGGSERHGRGGEEAEEKEAGRAGPAQQLGGATHLCSRPAEPEWPGSLAARTRRSAHAPTPPPSSRRLLQLLRLYHRRAQPGNHDGRAARAHPLPPFSPPPPVALPKRRWPHWEQKHSVLSTRATPEPALRPQTSVCACACAEV